MDTFDELKDAPMLDVFSQRKDGKLYIINKGCKSVVGVIVPDGNKFCIEGYVDKFDKEDDAKDVLMRGL